MSSTTKLTTGKTLLTYKGHWDTRISIWTNITFIVDYMQYKHRIVIPHKATLILPPTYLMENMPNMGRDITRKQPGYSAVFISTSSSGDTYELVTTGEEAVYDIQGRKIFTPPVYYPAQLRNPSNIEFKYQYSILSWS